MTTTLRNGSEYSNAIKLRMVKRLLDIVHLATDDLVVYRQDFDARYNTSGRSLTDLFRTPIEKGYVSIEGHGIILTDKVVYRESDAPNSASNSDDELVNELIEVTESNEAMSAEIESLKSKHAAEIQRMLEKIANLNSAVAALTAERDAATADAQKVRKELAVVVQKTLLGRR
jgi:hypothetical protein